MTGQQTDSRASRVIVGTALVGLGMFLFYGNLTGELVRITHVLGANGSAAFGLLPAVMLSVWQIVRAYSAGHQQFAHILLQHILRSAWPLLLAMAGTAMSRDAFLEQDQDKSSKK